MSRAIYEKVKERYKLIRDETATHSIRVSEMAKDFGEYMGLSKEECEKLLIGGLLHDIGKYDIPENILYKEGNLSNEELSVVQEHVIRAYKYLNIDALDKDISDIILQHHERVDGKGYPNRLNEYEINKLAKLLSIVDAYDAITNNRSYKEGISKNEALKIIKSGSKIRYDEKLVESFVKYVNKLYV